MAVPPLSPTELRAAKQAMRAHLRVARRDHVARLRAADLYDDALEALADCVLAHVTPGAIVALYQPFGDEIDPALLAVRLAERGHALALPHVAADRTTMRFLAWAPDEALFTGAFGLSQPHADAADVAPTLILTPLVGFDRHGGRIGQGAGFYDRAFARLPGAVRVGLAWSAQEVERLPLEPWDVPLHAVATEQDWIGMREVAL